MSWNRSVLLGLVSLFLTAVPGASRSADVGVREVPGFPGSKEFYLRGEIVAGDASRLERLIREHLLRETVGNIFIESNGGDAAEGVRLGAVAQKYVMSIEVGPKGCFSSCFFVFIASPTRLWGGGPVGVHRIYLRREAATLLSPEEFRRNSQALWQETERHLTEMQVPSEIIELMRNTPSDSIAILTEEQRDSLGMFSPWATEYLLARCGDRLEPGRTTRSEASTLFACSADLFYNEQRRVLGR